MRYYDVTVEKITLGRIRVWAATPEEACEIARYQDEDEWDVEWGSCGDSVEVTDYVEIAYVPGSVELWN